MLVKQAPDVARWFVLIVRAPGTDPSVWWGGADWAVWHNDTPIRADNGPVPVTSPIVMVIVCAIIIAAAQRSGLTWRTHW